MLLFFMPHAGCHEETLIMLLTVDKEEKWPDAVWSGVYDSSWIQLSYFSYICRDQLYMLVGNEFNFA